MLSFELSPDPRTSRPVAVKLVLVKDDLDQGRPARLPVRLATRASGGVEARNSLCDLKLLSNSPDMLWLERHLGAISRLALHGRFCGMKRSDWRMATVGASQARRTTPGASSKPETPTCAPPSLCPLPVYAHRISSAPKAVLKWAPRSHPVRYSRFSARSRGLLRLAGVEWQACIVGVSAKPTHADQDVLHRRP